MLNYLRAELYKLCHRKSFWITLGVMLALEALLVWGFTFVNAHGGYAYFEDSVLDIIPRILALGGYFTVVAGDMVFAGQYRNATLKNEVSFGLPRWRIYMGKFIAQLIAAFLLCFAMIGFYVAACRLCLPSVGDYAYMGHAYMDSNEVMLLLGKCLLAALPVWIGVQAMTCACLFLIKSGAASAITAVVLFGGLPWAMYIVGAMYSGYPFGRMLLRVREWMPSVLLDDIGFHLVEDYAGWLAKMCLTGGVWLVGSTALGLWRFQRREIN